MKYEHVVRLRDGRKCILRNANASDSARYIELYRATHSQTDFNRTYPEEMTMTVDSKAYDLERTERSADEIEILAIVDGKTVGNAGIERVGHKTKEHHRAEFGINILREYWSLGIGRALTGACIESARVAGYRQVELLVVGENDRARRLYESFGFVEFGCNPRGFLTREGRFQELISMMLVLS